MDTKTENIIVVCPFCSQENNPAFTRCWKCGKEFDEDIIRRVRERTENSYGIDWDKMLDDLSPVLYFTGIIALLFGIHFGWGFLDNVIFGKMTTQQYGNYYVSDLKTKYSQLEQWLPATIRRVTNQKEYDEPSTARRINEKIITSTADSYYSNASVYQFVTDYIDALWQIDGAYKRTQGVSDEDIAGLLTAIRNQSVDLQRAQTNISNYKNSNNRIIKIASIGASNAVGMLAAISDNVAATMEEILTQEKFDQSKYVVKQSKMQFSQDQAFERLMHSTVLVTHTLVDRTPDEKGFLSKLVIDEAEKQSLMQSIRDKFSPVPEFKVDLAYNNGAIAILYHFLNTSKHKTRDFQESV